MESADVDRQDTTDRDGDPEEQSGVHWVWKVIGVPHVGWDALMDGAWACFTRLVCLGVVISAVTKRFNLRWRIYGWIERISKGSAETAGLEENGRRTPRRNGRMQRRDVEVMKDSESR